MKKSSYGQPRITIYEVETTAILQGVAEQILYRAMIIASA